MLSIAPQGTGGGRSSVLHWNTARIIMAHSMWRLMSIVSPLVAYLPNSYCTCSSAWENCPSPSAAAQHSMDGMHSTEESSIPHSREKKGKRAPWKEWLGHLFSFASRCIVGRLAVWWMCIVQWSIGYGGYGEYEDPWFSLASVAFLLYLFQRWYILTAHFTVEMRFN